MPCAASQHENEFHLLDPTDAHSRNLPATRRKASGHISDYPIPVKEIDTKILRWLLTQYFLIKIKLKRGERKKKKRTTALNCVSHGKNLRLKAPEKRKSFWIKTLHFIFYLQKAINEVWDLKKISYDFVITQVTIT